MSMWRGFLIKKIDVANRENYGRQKMNSIIPVKKMKKSWILETVYGNHFLYFSDF